MSNRNSNNNNNNDNSNARNSNRVMGPTSALSSFLREHGIRVTNRSRRARREETNEEEQNEGNELVIDRFGNVEQQDTATASSSSSAAQIQTPESSGTANKDKKRKRKGKKKDSDDDSDSSDSDAADYLPSSSRKAPTGRARVMFCTQCNNRFVRKLTDDDDINLCPNCQAGTSSKKPKKKKVLPSVKKHVYSQESLPSLQDICISIIADNIDGVESFGFISDESFSKLAKIISRNRKLNDQISKLFMEPYRKELYLYDCTNMTENGLFMISQFCFRLEVLELIYCGHITDKVLAAYQDRLHDLKSLSLSGAFLITQNAWKAFFKKIGSRLECFMLRHTARFDKSCLEALVQNCPNLTRLEFGHINHLNSNWFQDIASLAHLESLELAWTLDEEQPLYTEDVIHLLSKIGPNLKELSIRGGKELTDAVLTEGVSKYCTKLKKLSLEQCEKLTAEAMTECLEKWQCKGLEFLDITRCILFDDQVLKAVIRHSGDSLKQLNIHSLELLTPTGLELLAGDGNEIPACKNLTHLDCGFVRSMDDFVLKKLIDNCCALKKVYVWGCFMLTETIKENNNLRIIGREMSAIQ